MEFIAAWIIWLLVGVTLLIFEMFTGTFFVFGFGLAALVVAFVAGLGFSSGVQWAVFLGASLLFVCAIRPLAKRFHRDPDRKAGVDRLFGKVAVVTEEISHRDDTGLVRIEHDLWRAISQTKCPLGAEVLITGVRGTHLVVSPRGGESER